MLNGKPHRIISGNQARVLCNAVVDLISRVQRPYVFMVTVTGLHPHVGVRQYTIAANDDNGAAMKGIQLFVKEFERVPAVLKLIV